MYGRSTKVAHLRRRRAATRLGTAPPRHLARPRWTKASLDASSPRVLKLVWNLYHSNKPIPPIALDDDDLSGQLRKEPKGWVVKRANH